MRRLIGPAIVAVLAAAFLVGSARVAMTSAPGDAAGPAGVVAAASGGPPGGPPSEGPAGSPELGASPSAVPGQAANPRPSSSASPSGTTSGPVGRRILDPRLDKIVRNWVIATGSPGASAAILWPDGRLWTAAYGEADAAHDTPLTPRTPFPLASITKTFTAALVLQLVDEGLIGLEDTVAPLLPDAKLHPKMTVRHLLDHTSGLPDMFRVTGIEPALNGDKDRAWTVDDALAYGTKDRVAPDTFWRYSNTGYVYLGELVERVTGKPWATLVRERLLDPLGLDRTFIQGFEEAIGTLARGHRVTGPLESTTKTPLGGDDPLSPFTSVVTAAGAAGAIAAPADEVARWAAALFGGGVLSKPTIKAAVADASRVDQFHPRTRYGLGVQIVSYAGTLTWGHSGSFIGIRNQMRWLPYQRVAVVVLTNQSRIDTHNLERSLIRRVLKDLQAPSPSPSPLCDPCD